MLQNTRSVMIVMQEVVRSCTSNAIQCPFVYLDSYFERTKKILSYNGMVGLVWSGQWQHGKDESLRFVFDTHFICHVFHALLIHIWMKWCILYIMCSKLRNYYVIVLEMPGQADIPPCFYMQKCLEASQPQNLVISNFRERQIYAGLWRD